MLVAGDGVNEGIVAMISQPWTKTEDLLTGLRSEGSAVHEAALQA